jgi:hypothetical protein
MRLKGDPIMPQLISRGRKPLKSMLVASVAAISIGAASPVVAQDTSTETTMEKSMSSITHKVEVGAIDLTNANMDEVTLREILTGKIKENADQLAGLNADRVRIPELRFSYEVTVEDVSTTNEMVLKEIILEDVRDGVAAKASVGETLGEFGSSGMEDNPMDEVDFTYGMSEIAALNLPALLGAYGMIEVEKTDEFETVYESYSLAGGSLTSEVFSCEFGAARSGTFRAKPSAMDMAKLTSMIEELEAAEQSKPTQAQISNIINFYAQLLYGFESDTTTMDGIACSGEEDDQKFTFSTGLISVGSFGNGIYPAFSVDNIDVVVEGDDAGTFSIDNFTFKEIDFGPTFEKLGEASDYTEEWFEANMRGLIPSIKGFSFSGMAFDVPNDEDGERVTGSIDVFDVTLAQYQNGIPADIRIEAKAVQADLPAKSDEEGVQQLIDAGFEQINMGFVADLDWDAEAQTINVNALTAAIKDMGTVEITGTIGGATEALFANDPQMAMMSAMSLAVTDLNVMMDDEGLVQLALAQAAAEQGAPVEAFTNQVTAMSQGMIVGMLGGADSAVQLGENVATFLGGNKKINVNLKSKSDSGLGMPQMMMLQSDPTKLLNFVDLTSTLE